MRLLHNSESRRRAEARLQHRLLVVAVAPVVEHIGDSLPVVGDVNHYPSLVVIVEYRRIVSVEPPLERRPVDAVGVRLSLDLCPANSRAGHDLADFDRAFH